ncbi:MAG TPA: hypothetical protein VK699_20010 [Terriglobales bacterium]|jgi:hypothetical protein|nr:hypothetical protein [Terriglobales bacterium]
MFCIKCGSELYPNTEVCPNCRFDNINRFDNVDKVPRPRIDSSTPTAPLLYPEAYVDGEILVVPRNAALPAICVKCGGVPQEPWLPKTFYSPNPLWSRGLLWRILRKRVQLLVPLCALHESKRKTRLWIGSILLVSCIPLSVAVAALLEGYESKGYPVETTALSVCLAMFITGRILISASRVLRPTYVGDSYARFKGAHREFLLRLKPVSMQTMGNAKFPALKT